jgi:hypothetical protein
MTGGDIFSFQKDEALGHAVKKLCPISVPINNNNKDMKMYCNC